MTWEYKVLDCDDGEPADEGELNIQGAEGWELAAIVDTREPHGEMVGGRYVCTVEGGRQFIFKRKGDA